MYCLHELVIYRKYTTALPPPPKPPLTASVSSAWEKKINVHHIHYPALALLSLCLSLYLSLILLYLIFFSLLWHKTSEY